MHAAGARQVALGCDHPPVVPADDDRPVAQLRTVALLDGGVERVAVKVGNGEIVEFWMSHDPRRAAAWAGIEDGVGPAPAVTTQGFHEPRIGQASVSVQPPVTLHSELACPARGGDLPMIPAVTGGARQQVKELQPLVSQNAGVL